MSGIDENHPNRKPITTTSSKAFNRSMTVNASFNAFPSKPSSKWYETANNSFKGKVKNLKNLFEPSAKPTSSSQLSSSSSSSSSFSSQIAVAKLRPARSFSSDFSTWSVLDASGIRFPGTEDRVVVYFTSLRGIRRTYEDCCAVRMIFRGVKVFVDERDVSMDIAYREELQGLLGEKRMVSLPQVFIKGRYVGGVDLIRQLNETGELRKILQVLPVKDRRFVCDSCGDARFVPCSNCSGSRKVFDEEDEEIKRCVECNENGLLRCPECCSS